MARLRIRLASGIGWCVVFAVAAAILVENLDGYHNHVGGDYSLSGPTMNWAHGWPYGFMARFSNNPKKGASPWPWPHYSRWPIDDAPAILVSRKFLAVDLLVVVFIIGGTAFAVYRWRRGWDDRPAYSLRSLFVLSRIVAAATIYLQQLIQNDRLHWIGRQRAVNMNPINSAEYLNSLPFRFYAHYVAQALIVAGLVLAVLGVCSWIMGIFSQIREVSQHEHGNKAKSPPDGSPHHLA